MRGVENGKLLLSNRIVHFHIYLGIFLAQGGSLPRLE